MVGVNPSCLSQEHCACGSFDYEFQIRICVWPWAIIPMHKLNIHKLKYTCSHNDNLSVCLYSNFSSLKIIPLDAQS